MAPAELRRPVALLLLGLALVLLPQIGRAADRGPSLPGTGFAVGANLQWSRVTPAAFNAGLGASAAAFGGSYRFPLTPDDEAALTRDLTQVSAQGAAAVVTLNPTVPLPAITPAMADEVASRLAATSSRLGVPLLVRFAPEMNGTWFSWGQQPAAYVAAFRIVAAAVHHRAPEAAMVWSPVIATGYPFGDSSVAPGSADFQAMDTDGDGRLTAADDPYAPFYPGDDAVDWSGIRFVHWGNSYPYGANAIPEAGSFGEALHGRAPGSSVDFTAVYADQRGKPLLLETAALFNTARNDGDTNGAIKQAWLEQILADVDAGNLRSLELLLWLDVVEPERELAGAEADWSLTADPALAPGVRRMLEASPATFGPALPHDSPTANLGGHAIAAIGVVLVIGTLLVMAALGCALPDRLGWAYVERDDGRDLRVDFLRGFAMILVVVDHIDLPSLYHLISYERIGVVSGAELFVFFSGGVLGLVYRGRIEREGWSATAPRIFRRAGTLYLTAVCISLLAYGLTFTPRANAGMLTTWTDKSTSVVYRLYPDPAQSDLFLQSVALLRSGPSQFNIMGLYVVLMLLTPFILLLVAAPRFKPPGIRASTTAGALWERRRLASPILLGASGALYLVQQLHPVKLFRAQFEDPFPLLAWQFLFVIGLVAGYRRAELVAWFRSRPGRVALALALALFALGMFFTWNNPYLESTWDVRLDLISASDFSRIYQTWFQRAHLRPGRLLNTIVAVIALYGLLTVCWRPLNCALGWLLIPIGAASLYVFIWQVFFSMVVANISLLQREAVLINSLGHTAVILIVWLMVRRRFLYRVIPR